MPKVFVGLSGGVDSSVSAALLIEAGYDVIGVYMKNWSRDLPGAHCPWAEDLADAKRVAVKLGIDLKVYDFEDEYKSKVVDYMIREYQAGRTPNPDIMCNQEIKFKMFLETALADGADMIATGHYARIINHKSTPGVFQLGRSVDDKKDQTYFLYRVSERALAKTLFPIGHLLKSDVRKIASDRGLITARKKDSVGICFVGRADLEDFLGQYISSEPGEFIDEDSGKRLGWHKGAPFYTLGQRHGLNLGGGLPYYVVGKDAKNNIVFVSRRLNQDNLWTRQIKISDLHWINQAPVVGQTYLIRMRHQAPLVNAKLVELGNRAVLEVDSELRAVTPGQSVVVYDGEVCLGGGIVV